MLWCLHPGAGAACLYGKVGAMAGAAGKAWRMASVQLQVTLDQGVWLAHGLGLPVQQSCPTTQIAAETMCATSACFW